MFDPSLGRWTTEDPSGFAGGDVNLYRFVDNSPTNYTDPSGRHLIAADEYIGKQYLNWLRGGKDNIFSAAAGGEAGPGLTDKQVVARTLPNGAMLFLTLDAKAEEAVRKADKYKGDLGSTLSSLSSPINLLMSLEESEKGEYTVKGKKMRLNLEDATKRSLPWIQAWVNSGGVREKTDEQAGPDVTDWFARDLLDHMKHRVENNNVEAFRHQAADLMTQKWLDFGGPKEGRGVATVTLGKTVMHRNELGNIELLFILRIWPPTGFEGFKARLATGTGIKGDTKAKLVASAIGEVMGIRPQGVDPAVQRVVNEKYDKVEHPVDKAAVLSYAIIPNHRQEAFGKWTGDQYLWRSDNLVAFGVGAEMATELLKKVSATLPDGKKGNLDEARKEIDEAVKTEAGRTKLYGFLKQVLTEFFGGDEAANKRLADAAKKYANLQPDGQGMKITSEALSFTTAYGGFNLNSLQPSTETFQGTASSIGMAGVIKKRYDEYKQNGGKLTIEEWRVQEYEHYTRPSGVPFPKAP